MRIVIDEKIPYLRDALEQMGHSVTAMPGYAISNSDLTEAGALFVRTRTHCNAALLDNTPVRFIGTATIGHDHIDKEYCHQKGIVWTNAPGCNADAVLQYVQSVIYSWARSYDINSLEGLTLGIVGVGQIGSRVERWAREAGLTVLLNDPPRAERGEGDFVPLHRIAQECDIITFHTTLSKSGSHPSYHLADAEFFGKTHRCRLLINASRGPVVDNSALLNTIENKRIAAVALDVWENEPQLNLELLKKAFIATPHIAGYSAEGKINASRMMVEAFAQFSRYCGQLPIMSLPTPAQPIVKADTLSEALLYIYDPQNDTNQLKSSPNSFEELRNNYNLRREPKAYTIEIKKE